MANEAILCPIADGATAQPIFLGAHDGARHLIQVARLSPALANLVKAATEGQRGAPGSGLVQRA